MRSAYDRNPFKKLMEKVGPDYGEVQITLIGLFLTGAIAIQSIALDGLLIEHSMFADPVGEANKAQSAPLNPDN